jgi:hypothetical protein
MGRAVQVIEALDARGDRPLDRRFLGHVGDRRQRVVFAELPRRGLELGLVDAHQMHARAFRHEQPRGG